MACCAVIENHYDEKLHSVLNVCLPLQMKIHFTNHGCTRYTALASVFEMETVLNQRRRNQKRVNFLTHSRKRHTHTEGEREIDREREIFDTSLAVYC